MTNEGTIRELFEQHPEWRDLPIVIANSDGTFDYLSGSASVSEITDDEENGLKVLMFSPN